MTSILLLTGITMLLGTFGGKLFSRMKIPQVVGYIMEDHLVNELVVAGDISKEVKYTLAPEQSVKEAMEIFRTKELGYLPVITDGDSRRLVGILEHRALKKFINQELLNRHNIE